MILSCNNISKAFGTDSILEHVSFHIEEREKAAIVGINGAGKTTLFKIIAGQMGADEGDVVISRGKTLGYLAQHQDISSDNTIYDELMEVKKPILMMEQQIRELEIQMKHRSGEALEALYQTYSRLNHEFELMNGYAWQSEITGVLKGLGFTEDEFKKPVKELSGGQKTRVSLGKLLLSKPDIILLDEPTNHLDLRSKEALETALVEFEGTLIFVSHDRYFLNAIPSKIIELSPDGLRVYQGNFDFYLAEKKKEEEAAPLPMKTTVSKAPEARSNYRSKQERSEQVRRRTRLQKLELLIEETDSSIKRLEEEIASPENAADYEKLSSLCRELEEAKALHEEYFTEWAGLAEE